MLGITPLTRSLPDTSPDTKGVFIAEEDEDGILWLSVLPESLDINSAFLVSDSGIVDHMFSSSLTTSAILGRASGSSSQHFKANVKNFSTCSDG